MTRAKDLEDAREPTASAVGKSPFAYPPEPDGSALIRVNSHLAQFGSDQLIVF